MTTLQINKVVFRLSIATMIICWLFSFIKSQYEYQHGYFTSQSYWVLYGDVQTLPVMKNDRIRAIRTTKVPDLFFVLGTHLHFYCQPIRKLVLMGSFTDAKTGEPIVILTGDGED